MKKLKIAIVILLIIAITSIGILLNLYNTEVKTISSEKQLLKIMEGENDSTEFFENILTLAKFRAEQLYDASYYHTSYNRDKTYYYGDVDYESSGRNVYDIVTTLDSATESASSSSTKSSSILNISSSKKDYSTTNIQVENVDEADITKTDGDYIYSISDYQVIITDVRDPQNIKIASKINSNTNMIPEDLILYNNKLIVIYEKGASSSSSRYYSEQNTIVKTYDITSKESTKEQKSIELHQEYYTSRCIDNNLYVISSGNLRYDNNTDKDAVDRSYKEDGETKQIPLKSIKYLKDAPSKVQTIIATENLDDTEEDVKISSFLMDVSNAYVSEKSIYLLNEKYEGIETENNDALKALFGIRGIWGFKEEYDSGTSYGSRKLYTEIYKFDIEKNGKVTFVAKNKVDGQAINQYSLDEKDGHFRIATYEFSKGAKVTIFDEDLNEIGHSDRVGANEKMYSTRFMGDKVYLVTYQTIDPLFVIDLSNEAHPKVLGELSIPGYSMYLHPYDENHIIGIGMETKETVHKDSNGRVISTTARIVGMKMALFDVSDVRNPKQISQVVIGDSRTKSSILTNPKALLFSKEKELIAIPVNNYNSDFEITNSDTYESVVNSYTSTSKSYISEGYCVYKINAKDGFQFKGTITHENDNSEKSTSKSYYSSSSKLLRGLYIENNLYTISESKIKVNNLDTLEMVSELKIGNLGTLQKIR